MRPVPAFASALPTGRASFTRTGRVPASSEDSQTTTASLRTKGEDGRGRSQGRAGGPSPDTPARPGPTSRSRGSTTRESSYKTMRAAGRTSSAGPSRCRTSSATPPLPAPPHTPGYLPESRRRLRHGPPTSRPFKSRPQRARGLPRSRSCSPSTRETCSSASSKPSSRPRAAQSTRSPGRGGRSGLGWSDRRDRGGRDLIREGLPGWRRPGPTGVGLL